MTRESALRRIFKQSPPNKEQIALTVALALILVAAIFIFSYTDITDTLENSVLLLDSIVKGRFLSFYTHSLENADAVYAANYELPIYFIFLLWNLPIAIAYILGVPCLGSRPALLWCKGLIVVSLLACVWLLWKICRVCADSRKEEDSPSLLFVGLLLLSSPLVFLPEFIACQYDCIMLAFVLAGKYFYLTDRQGLFLLTFCLAFPLKSFSFFVFLPLLLLKEKRVWRILAAIAAQLAIPVTLGLVYRGDPAHGFLIGTQNRDAIGRILKSTLQIGGTTVHVFIAAFLLLCVLAYFKEYTRERAIYYAALSMASVVVLLPIRSFWLILTEPFLVLLMLERPEKLKANLLLHTAGGVAGMLWHLYDHWIYNTGGITRLLERIGLAQEPEVTRFGAFDKLIDAIGLGRYMPVLHTAFVVCFILLLVINHPSFAKKGVACRFSARASMVTRLLALAGTVAVLLAAAYIPGKWPVVDTLLDKGEMKDAENMCFDADLSEGAEVVQAFSVDEALEATKLTLQFHQTNDERNNRGRFRVRLCAREGEEVLYESVVGNSSVEKKKSYELKLPGVSLEPGEYCVVVTGIETVRSKSLYLCHASEPVEQVPAAVVNGMPQELPIGFALE